MGVHPLASLETLGRRLAENRAEAPPARGLRRAQRAGRPRGTGRGPRPDRLPVAPGAYALRAVSHARRADPIAFMATRRAHAERPPTTPPWKGARCRRSR